MEAWVAREGQLWQQVQKIFDPKSSVMDTSDQAAPPILEKLDIVALNSVGAFWGFPGARKIHQ